MIPITINLEQNCVRDNAGISCFYLLGLEAPHYPVPAIAIGVSISEGHVAIFDKHHPYNGREWYKSYQY